MKGNNNDYYYSIEEREREIASVKPKTRPKKAGRYLSGWWRLYQSFENQRLITTDDLKSMVGKDYDQPVISFYLNLDPEKIKREDKKVYLSVFNALVRQEKKARREWLDQLDRAAKERLEEDLELIKKYLMEVFEPEGLKSLVVYKSGGQLGFALSFNNRLHHRDQVVINSDPYILPLVSVLNKYRRTLSVYVSKDESVFYRLHLGIWERIDRIQSFTPDDAVDHSRPGKVQRNRLSWLYRHYKKTALMMSQLIYKEGFDAVILTGTKETLDEFDGFLNTVSRQKVIATNPITSKITPKQLRDVSFKLLEGYEQEQEAVQIKHLMELVGLGTVVTGLPAVIEAANRFLLKEIYAASDLKQAGFICRGHHFLSIEKRACPFCNQELVPVENLLDELIELAQLYHLDYYIFDHHQDKIKKMGGVAGVVYPGK
ncbi:MAG: hypothetical protein GXP43_02675 [bacterium]|nr:hypothetical protein [bacterium]